MKATGVVRKLDELGRIVLPMELRRKLGIQTADGMEIFIDEDRIVLRKYAPGCVFCGEVEEVMEFRGKMVCRECRKRLGAVTAVETW